MIMTRMGRTAAWTASGRTDASNRTIADGALPMNSTARPKHGVLPTETIAYSHDSDRSGFPDAVTVPSSGRASERYYLSSGDRPLDGYTIKRAIGRGGFGEVYYAISDSGKEVALKLLLRNVEIEKRGVQQCMNLKSPHLIAIFDMRTTDDGDTFVVMEYVAGPSLAQILERHPDGLPPHDVRMWLKGLVDGVAYLHDHGIVHRDLKPANLFLEEGVVKIGDYGLSKFIANSQEAGHSASVGTCHYMAPEISTGKYQKPIDIYAIGVILFEMITGRVPFEGETPHEVLMKHLTSRPDLSPLPEPFRTLVGKALAKDPARRPQGAYELLVPEDAPRPVDVRFIGDGKSSPIAPEAPSAAPAKDDRAAPAPAATAAPNDVLHIGEEESSVFYIGPNTMPPGRPRRRGWLRAAAGRRGRGRSPRSPGPTRRPIPATPPPPLPSSRMRVAEAATSMLVAFPLCVLFGLPMSALFGAGPGSAPELSALLGASALLGVWAVLVPSKLWEGRRVDTITRRCTFGAVGVAVGAIVVTAIDWVHAGPAFGFDRIMSGSVGFWGDVTGLESNQVAAPGMLADSALIFAFGPWASLAARDRYRRLRVWPVAWSALIGLVACSLVPAPVSWSVAVPTLMAVVLQLVSPRCPASARHRHARSGAEARVA